jgi:hypothetical protein
MVNRWETLLGIQSLELVPTALCELADASLEIRHSFVSSRLGQSCSAIAPTHMQLSHTFHAAKIIVPSFWSLVNLSNSKLITRRLHQCNVVGLKTRNSRRLITWRVGEVPCVHGVSIKAYPVRASELSFYSLPAAVA